MVSTITALFDSRPDAEAARARLGDAKVDAGHVHIHDKSSEGHREDGYSTHQDRGIWDRIRNVFLPDEDRHTYEEGVRRGGFLLTADVDDARVDDAVRALRDAGSVDIDERADEWRSSGWDYSGGVTPVGGMAAAIGVGGAIGVREEFAVGTRDAARSDARVRAYAADTPFQEELRRRVAEADVAGNIKAG